MDIINPYDGELIVFVFYLFKAGFADVNSSFKWRKICLWKIVNSNIYWAFITNDIFVMAVDS